MMEEPRHQHLYQEWQEPLEEPGTPKANAPPATEAEAKAPAQLLAAAAEAMRATVPEVRRAYGIMPVNSWPGVANWRGSAEPCGVDSSTEDQPNIFPCAASRFFL